MWDKDKEADHNRQHRADEHRAGRNILSDPGQLVILLRRDVDGQLNSRVKHLCHKNDPDGDKNQGKLAGRDVQKNTGEKRTAGDRQVYAHIALRAERMQEAPERKAKARDEFVPLVVPGLF